MIDTMRTHYAAPILRAFKQNGLVEPFCFPEISLGMKGNGLLQCVGRNLWHKNPLADGTDFCHGIFVAVLSRPSSVVPRMG